MIRRPTVVYIVILAALIGTYFYFKNREPAATDIAVTPGASEEVKYLFTAEDGIPTDIRIVAKSGETVEVARDANNEWVLHRPIEAKAEQGAAEAAASQASTLRIL